MNRTFYFKDPLSYEKIEQWRYVVAKYSFERNSTEELLNILKSNLDVNASDYSNDIIKKILVERGFNLENLVFL